MWGTSTFFSLSLWVSAGAQISWGQRSFAKCQDFQPETISFAEDEQERSPSADRVQLQQERGVTPAEGAAPCGSTMEGSPRSPHASSRSPSPDPSRVTPTSSSPDGLKPDAGNDFLYPSRHAGNKQQWVGFSRNTLPPFEYLSPNPVASRQHPSVAPNGPAQNKQ